MNRNLDVLDPAIPYLNANALAWQKGLKRFDTVIQGVSYRSLPVSQYRVWCLEQLQKRARELPETHGGELEQLLLAHDCLQPLFELQNPGSHYDEGDAAPFKGRKVHYHNRTG